MSNDNLPGYKGNLKKSLKKINAKIGDQLKVIIGDKQYIGNLIPRVKHYKDQYLILKLKSGYNIGLDYRPNMIIKKIGKSIKPEFKVQPLPKTNRELPKVSIISTGGTIASRVDYVTGGVYSAMNSLDLLSIVPELVEVANLETEVLYSLLSEDIGHEHWEGMAKCAYNKINDGAQGIILTHGTDTMSYSSAALSFAVQNLPVPIIFIGSQRSSDRPSSDSATNLISGVYTAVKAPFAEVCIGMHETTSDTTILYLRGTKVRKCHTSSRYAFQPVNDWPLARYKEKKLEIINENYRKRQNCEPQLFNKFSHKVGYVKFHPNLDQKILEYYIDEEYRGIIIEATGLGQISKNFWPLISKAKREGMLIGITSQCIWGRVHLNVYSHGRELAERGAIALGDMHSETAFVKMKWVFGQTDNLEEAKDLMIRNIVGEYNSRTPFLGVFS
jgi:glutamyl-tRNA(Gln) amidotransferase subunit D